MTATQPLQQLFEMFDSRCLNFRMALVFCSCPDKRLPRILIFLIALLEFIEQGVSLLIGYFGFADSRAQCGDL